MEGKLKLKIAQIAPLGERVPPKKYGGTERVVYTLTEHLVKRGHKVTLFASGDSITSAKLVSVYPKSLREAGLKDPYGLNDWLMLHIGTAYMRQHEFDIINDHTGTLGLPTAHLASTPVVMTLHGPFTPSNRQLFETLDNPYLVTISKAQANSAPPKAKIRQTIYNGLELEHSPFRNTHQGYLLFVGRISIEKGTHLAIEVAQELNLPLVIAAKLDNVDLAYFDEYVRPRLSGEQIKWVGEVDEKERNRLMANAICLLHPITWREPFGLTMIEAQACGCPVVALKMGSVSEIVVDGQTGFVVNDIEEMIGAVKKIDQIKRIECRRHALKNFNAELIAERYEQLYYEVIEERGQR